MSCFTFQLTAYADFKTVVDDLLTTIPGRVYYRTATSQFQCIFVADDASHVISLGVISVTPGGFSTDFPSAILVNIGTSPFTFPQMGPSGWNVMGA